MAKTSPVVFVSSTYYDLKQIRSDLFTFIGDQLGFTPFLSENDSFPVDSSVSAIDNCIITVEEHADIFVLVIGTRYGYVTKAGQSVTNLEYLSARKKGIPIFVYVNRNIMTLLPMWEKNPDANFSSSVDNPKIFEFVRSIVEKENVWVFSYDLASDIISSLKKQIAYLLYRSLCAFKKLNSCDSQSLLSKLDGEELRFAIDKPTGWEYLLLGTLIIKRINKADYYKRDLEYDVIVKEVQNLDTVDKVVSWINLSLQQAKHLISSLESLWDNGIEPAIGREGEPGSIDHLIYLSDRLGMIYEGFIKMNQEFKIIVVDDIWKDLLSTLAVLCSVPIKDIHSYCDKWSIAINKIKNKTPGEIIELDLKLTISNPNMDSFNRNLEFIKLKCGLY